MEAGKLRHRVGLQMPLTSPDASGQPQQGWSTVIYVRASVEPASGIERFADAAVEGRLTHVVVMRYRADIKSSWRIAYGDRILQIVSVRDVGERRRQLELACREVV